MNFELLDNLFQVAALGCAAVVAGILALRHKSRHCLILSLAYACFAMGTLYFVLYLAIIGNVPQVFYVAEVSWLASYLFFLSLQILRTESIKLRISWLPGICTVLSAAVFLFVRILPSYFISLLFELTMVAILYLTVFRLQSGAAYRQTDAVILACILLQMSLYAVSGFIKDFTHFNLYFVVDIALTLSFLSLLPLTLREVTKK